MASIWDISFPWKGSLSEILHGIITAPILLAIEEFPQLQEIINRVFNGAVDVNLVPSARVEVKRELFMMESLIRILIEILGNVKEKKAVERKFMGPGSKREKLR